MDSVSLHTDELTGLHNRNYLKEVEEDTLRSFIQKKVPFSIVIVDIDHFKDINDTHGHLKGDEILREFAHYLRDGLRKADTVVRYGGDEFVCIMPQTMRQDAEWVYQRILKGVRERRFSGLNITLSVGIATYPGNGNDFESLFRVADQALYDAKREGRDRIGVVQRKLVEVPIHTFINRLEELKVLRSVLTDGARLRIVVVKGNVGIGKTRFVKEVMNSLREKEIVWSDCLLMAEGIAYYPIRDALKYYLKRQNTAIIEKLPLVYSLELGKLVPEIAEHIEAVPEGVEVVMDKYRLYESVRRVLEIDAQPKIVTIDNIQWIDRESVEVIKYLVRSLSTQQITFMFIYRKDEKTAVLEELLSYLNQELDVSEIELQPFGYDKIRESVQAIIGEQPHDELVNYVLRESGGIPFYIEEIMRGLYDKRHLIVENETWIFKEPKQEIIPKSLADITLRKFRQLSKEAQRIVEIAAIEGWFDIDIIQKITGFNEGEIIGLVQDASRLGMVKQTKGRFGFTEEMSRHALYTKNIEGVQAIRLHRQIGEELEVRSKDTPNDYCEDLAYHFYHGQEREKGIQYCIMAGDKAKQVYANRNAIQYYTWALELLAGAKTVTSIDCLLKRADLLNVTGDNQGALKDIDEALTHSELLGDTTRKAEALLKRISVYESISNFKQTVIEAEECLRLCREIGDDERRAQALNIRGTAYWRTGENQKAMECYTAALMLFRRVANKKGEAAALANMANFTSDFHEAMRYLDEALRLHREANNRRGEAATYNNIGARYCQSGEYTHGLRCFQDALKIYQEMGNKQAEAMALGNIGLVYGDYLGNHQEALKHNSESVRLRREIGDKLGHAIGLSAMSLTHFRLGNYHNALSLSKSALELAQEIGEKSLEAYTLNQQGFIHQVMGDYRMALAMLEKAKSIIDTINVGWLTHENLYTFAEYYLALDEYDKAKEYAEHAYTKAKELNSKQMLYSSLAVLSDLYLDEEKFDEFKKTMKAIDDLGEEVRSITHNVRLDLLRGSYYTKTKDYDKAAHCLEASLAACEKQGLPLDTGVVHYYYALLEHTRGNATQSKEHLTQAVSIFDALGALGWKEKAETLLP